MNKVAFIYKHLACPGVQLLRMSANLCAAVDSMT